MPLVLAAAAVVAMIAAAALVYALRLRAELRDYVEALASDRQPRGARELSDLAEVVDAMRVELVRRNEAISSQRGVLLQILNGLGEGLLAVDRQRRVVLANPRFSEMFGVNGDLVGRPLVEVVRVAAVFGAFDAALDGQEASERFPVRIGIAERKIETRAFPLESGDIAAVALFIDVTPIERLEQIRRNFISDFSHEVRTPLTGLHSAVESFELAGDQMTEEENHQLRRIMSRQLARLERLVDDLSELSRIESGDIPLERTSIDLFTLIEDLCEEFRDRAALKTLRFVVTGSPVHVYADAVRIQQAFSNLIDNAIKYGGQGSTIDLDISSTEESGVVRVTDHGEGIAPEEKERIFRRFYRIDKSRSQDIAGTGLGLAITKHLVLLHRGTIDVESTPGKGSTFIVALPCYARNS